MIIVGVVLIGAAMVADRRPRRRRSRTPLALLGMTYGTVVLMGASMVLGGVSWRC